MATTFTRVFVKKTDRADKQEAATPTAPSVRVNESVATKFKLASSDREAEDCEIHEFSNQSGMELWNSLTNESNGYSPTVPMEKLNSHK